LLEMNILLAELVHYRKGNSSNDEFSDVYSLLNSEKCLVKVMQSLPENLSLLSTTFSDDDFLQAYNHCLIYFAEKAISEKELALFKQKINALSDKFKGVRNKKELISEVIRTGFLYLFNLIYFEKTETILSLVKSRFS